VMYVTVAD